jgi:hypothetical protein
MPGYQLHFFISVFLNFKQCNDTFKLYSTEKYYTIDQLKIDTSLYTDLGSACYGTDLEVFLPYNNSVIGFLDTEKGDPIVSNPGGVYVAYQWVPCPAGSYCATQDFFSVICPAGSYCPQGSYIPIICPTGSFCLEGSSFLISCPFYFSCPNQNSILPYF